MRQEKRGCNECDGTCGLKHALIIGCGRHTIGEPAVDEIPGNNGNEPRQHETRVGRTPEELHARHRLIHQLECRRVASQRVEQNEKGRDAEEANLTRPGEGADQTK